MTSENGADQHFARVDRGLGPLLVQFKAAAYFSGLRAGGRSETAVATGRQGWPSGGRGELRSVGQTHINKKPGCPPRVTRQRSSPRLSGLSEAGRLALPRAGRGGARSPRLRPWPSGALVLDGGGGMGPSMAGA